MASNIDPTVPPAGAASTADVRLNFAHAKAEITALQGAVAGAQADADAAGVAAAAAAGDAASAAAAAAAAQGTADGAAAGVGALDLRVGALEDGAPALDTTGDAVDVSAAAPPTAGQVLTATSATTATWQTPAAPSTATSVEFHPFAPTSSGAHSVGNAGRIRCVNFSLPFSMDLTHIRFGNGAGAAAGDNIDLGLYDLAGDRICHSGALNPKSLGWGAGAEVHDVAMLGGPITLPPGDYVFAFTDEIAWFSPFSIPAQYQTGMRTYIGYPPETCEAGGALPAAISLEVGDGFTQDAVDRTPWFALIGS